ncbi:hypothetical protein H4R21_005909 [Coemansia helicoidea]|uniref:Uncharacterized protein n=1 Tax=Coemansia helicoidea TaxID=1286919 RepID=A0ACC1KRK5_9FUNG|nr:hypothetical protein H4R21_005909 [Coemansia helicoidea]
MLPQRYLVNDDYYSDGPVILYSVGERAVQGAADIEGSPVYDLARQTRALVVLLELRFYGASLPDRADQLGFLSVEQMMADIHRFTMHANGTAGRAAAAAAARRWVLVGGSFAGSLAAWTRYQYPDLDAMVIASGAPMRLVDEYRGFDRVAGQRIPCAPALSQAVRRVDRVLDRGRAARVRAAKRLFGLDLARSAEDLAGAISARLAELVQRPAGPEADAEIEGFCRELVRGPPVEALARTARGLAAGGPAGCPDGDRRAWLWQQCTQIGLWQTAPRPTDRARFARRLRSRRLSLAFFDGVCRRCFPGLRARRREFRAFADRARRAYESDGGGRDAVFTVGELDPWRPLAVRGALVVAGAAHAQDLQPPAAGEPPSVAVARRRTALAVRQWLSAGPRSARPAGASAAAPADAGLVLLLLPALAAAL